VQLIHNFRDIENEAQSGATVLADPRTRPAETEQSDRSSEQIRTIVRIHAIRKVDIDVQSG